ncbi:unnamed protein product [Closterium sp. Naga37s-1]|nr:unnamed protein product [Closterium sp. Naga37s-1]
MSSYADNGDEAGSGECDAERSAVETAPSTISPLQPHWRQHRAPPGSLSYSPPSPYALPHSLNSPVPSQSLPCPVAVSPLPPRVRPPILSPVPITPLPPTRPFPCPRHDHPLSLTRPRPFPLARVHVPPTCAPSPSHVTSTPLPRRTLSFSPSTRVPPSPSPPQALSSPTAITPLPSRPLSPSLSTLVNHPPPPHLTPSPSPSQARCLLLSYLSLSPPLAISFPTAITPRP